MPNPRYISGTRFERDVLRLLSGWYDVQRGAKSGGICDLVCTMRADDLDPRALDMVRFHPDRVLYVSCKRDGACGVVEWNAHYWKTLRAAATPILAWKEKRGPLQLYRMIGPKSGRRGVPQPWEPWEFQRLIEAK